MSDIYVLVHGAWHTGADLEQVATVMRGAGHTVYCPTLAGNRPSDDRANAGLEDAIASAIEYIEERDLKDIRLVGHSYGGMVISGVVDRVPQRIRRLVYLNAFVPHDGESAMDMVPSYYAGVFEEQAALQRNSVMLPFDVWRDCYMNDGDLALAESCYKRLNPHPYRTFTDKITLRRPLHEIPVGRSYVNCQQDITMPHSMPWHPRLSERLGLYRLVECPGGHETLFSNPKRLAQALLEAGRD